MKLLHIDSSILGDHSTSRVLTKNIVTQWVANHPDTQVEYLDVAAQAPAHFDFAAMGYRAGIADEALSPAQRAANLQTDAPDSAVLAGRCGGGGRAHVQLRHSQPAQGLV